MLWSFDGVRQWGNLTQLLSSLDREVDRWENCVLISCQVAMGMAHLHCHPVIHLDLKSQNILIERVEQTQEKKKPFLCKICDFGQSKMADVSSITQDRSDGSVPSGTVAYLHLNDTKHTVLEVKKRRWTLQRSQTFSAME
eukprot:m.164663 g.164663  ORF g.164663 m.164663 type:complete len:140 (+) comp38885_c0_seq15:1682-2101(+)